MQRWCCDLTGAGDSYTVGLMPESIGDAAKLRSAFWSRRDRKPAKLPSLAHRPGKQPLNRLTRLNILRIFTEWAGALWPSIEAGRGY